MNNLALFYISTLRKFNLNVAKKKNQLLGDFSYCMVKAVKAPDTFNLIVGLINLSFLLLNEIQLD